MPRRSLLLAALLGTVVALTATATAGAAPADRRIPPDPKARQLNAAFNLMDHQGRGYLTLDDFLRGRPYAPRLFSLLDRDGDGTIDRKEFGRSGLRSAEFARLDRNKTGRVTQAEFLKGWNAQLFTALAGGKDYLNAGDLRPGFSIAAAPPPPAPAPAAAPAAPPRRSLSTAMGCWYPLNRSDRWGLTFPLGPGCGG